MSKYGDTNNTNSIDSTDVDAMYGIIRTSLDDSFNSGENKRAFFDMDIDENPNSDLNESINEFSKLNVHRKFAFAGPSAHELLKLNHIANGNLSDEEYNDADYDFSVGSKGANVDMHNNTFVASFPTAIDYRSWNDQDEDEAKESGWVKLYSKDAQYKQHKNLLPPTEFLKTKDFLHSDFGLRSIAKSDKFVAVSSYLYGDSDKQEGLVNIYEKLSSGSFIFRHLIKVENITRAPTVEILDDQLFVGNPTQPPGLVRIYSLSELSKNQNFYGYNTSEPTALLSETDLGITQSSTPSFFGHTIKAYSDGTTKLLIIGAPHFSEFRNDSTATGDMEIGAVYIYKYDDEQSSWVYKQRILPLGWENIPVEDGYGFEKLAIKFGYSFDFRFKEHGSSPQWKGILLIGAPKFYKQIPSLTRQGRVYCYSLNNNEVFSYQDVIDLPESEVNIQFDDVGLFELGRSIALDDQDNAWIASNPPQGSTVLRYGVTNLEHGMQTWTFEESTKISEDRDGGFLTTNLNDVVFGSANNIKVFQDDGSITPLENVETDIHDSLNHISEEDKSEIADTQVPYLNKQFPSEWGSAPDMSFTYLVPLPFGYGLASPYVAGWIQDNSTGDVRKSKYLQKVFESEKMSVEQPDYYELWENGNPTIKITPWSSTIGTVVDVHSPHGHLIAEYGNPLVYKGRTAFTLILNASTPNNKMASWKVNGQFIDGCDRIELLVRGEDMNVSVEFKRNETAVKSQIKCVECRRGELTIYDKKV